MHPESRPFSTSVSSTGRSESSTKKGTAAWSSIKTLLTGLPSVQSPVVTTCSVLLNIALALVSLDFLFRSFLLYPSSDVAFSRVGYVSATTANVLIREPDQNQLPLVVQYQEAVETSGDAKWVEEAIVYSLTTGTDYTVPIEIKGLKPSTKYRYSLSNNMTGNFITAPLSSTEAANRLTFVTSSCLKPNFPYSPFSHPLRILGLEQLSNVVAKLPSAFRPSFMLFLGDFIYIDVPQRFGSSVSHYRSEYRRIYASPSWSVPEEDPAIQLPWLHTLDDHEIENDWHMGNLTPPYLAAVEPYIHYHVSVNPPIPPTPFAKPENTTYFSFIHGPASFFMLDTRTYRSAPSEPNSTILGSAQLQSLLAYLVRPESAEVRWKIVASSVPFTKNWQVGRSDTWGGFLNERSTVFEEMWRAERELGVRVILLSGDRHEFAATRFPDPALGLSPEELKPQTAGKGLHEFSVGPLSMFYLPVRTYSQTDNEDVVIKYVPDGNSKFGMIDIAGYDENVESTIATGRASTSKALSSVLTYSLYVDGNVVWKYRLSLPLPSHDPAAPMASVLRDESSPARWSVRFNTAMGQIGDTGKRIWRSISKTLPQWHR